MSANTKFRGIYASVPVDYFDIANGPSALKCMEVQSALHEFEDGEYILEFTLQTLASSKKFKRSLKMKSITSVLQGEFNFVAVFNGQIVSGTYDMIAKSGYFNAD